MPTSGGIARMGPRRRRSLPHSTVAERSSLALGIILGHPPGFRLAFSGVAEIPDHGCMRVARVVADGSGAPTIPFSEWACGRAGGRIGGWAGGRADGRVGGRPGGLWAGCGRASGRRPPPSDGRHACGQRAEGRPVGSGGVGGGMCGYECLQADRHMRSLQKAHTRRLPKIYMLCDCV